MKPHKPLQYIDGSGWLIGTGEPQAVMVGFYPTLAEAQAACDRTNALLASRSRKNRAVDWALANGVPEREIWDAIDRDTLLDFESRMKARECRRCSRMLHETAFCVNRSEPDGRHRFCRECERLRLEQHRAAKATADEPIIVEATK